MHVGDVETCLSVDDRRGDTPASGASCLSARGGQGALRGTFCRHVSSHAVADGTRQKYSCSFTNCIKAANASAAGLVNLLAKDFSCFRDEFKWQGRKKPVRFLKRAQILVADLWACFQGESYGTFRDIDKLTMFADYRVPQVLSTLGCLSYSPPLMTAVKEKESIESGGNWEMQLRGKSSIAPLFRTILVALVQLLC